MLMLISLPALPVSILATTVECYSLVGWSLALLSFVYGAGTLISGAPILDLVHDEKPPWPQRKIIGWFGS